MQRRDIVVIGASAGGVKLLLELAPELPADLPASLFVVLHTAEGFRSPLPDLLSRRGPLPAVHPVHGEPIERGKIYVAPADNHLQLRPGFVEVVRGPRENGHRPAVDTLFRTAARAYGPRVVGVVLSGHLDCGTAGMLSVRARGGVAVVQDPRTAAAPGMPGSVLKAMAVDHVIEPLELPGLLSRLVREPAGPAPTPERAVHALEGEGGGSAPGVVCPLCHGALTEAKVGAFDHYRCHVGHTFSLSTLASHQAEEVERALWASARALEEAAAVSARLRSSGSPELRRRFAEREAQQRAQVDVIRRLLLETEEPAARPGEVPVESPAAGP